MKAGNIYYLLRKVAAMGGNYCSKSNVLRKSRTFFYTIIAVKG